MGKLNGKIAIVTGASRGGGKGIALSLGEAGATVYITGRGDQLESVASGITERGGKGIAVRVDHSRDKDVEGLFTQIMREQGRLDLLVNNAWGGYENYDTTFAAPFWEQPLSRWDKMLTIGLRSHMVGSWHAAPIMIAQQSGLIVNTTTYMKPEAVDPAWFGSVFYDTTKNAINRMAAGMAINLRPYNVAALALSPGFMRTEAILDAFGVNETTWQTAPQLQHSESPYYIGRVIAALAADENIMAKSGGLFVSGDLAAEYGLTDIDERYIPSFYKAAPPLW